jgi:hypothetical protein
VGFEGLALVPVGVDARHLAVADLDHRHHSVGRLRAAGKPASDLSGNGHDCVASVDVLIHVKPDVKRRTKLLPPFAYYTSHGSYAGRQLGPFWRNLPSASYQVREQYSVKGVRWSNRHRGTWCDV